MCCLGRAGDIWDCDWTWAGCRIGRNGMWECWFGGVTVIDREGVWDYDIMMVSYWQDEECRLDNIY